MAKPLSPSLLNLPHLQATNSQANIASPISSRQAHCAFELFQAKYWEACLATSKQAQPLGSFVRYLCNLMALSASSPSSLRDGM